MIVAKAINYCSCKNVLPGGVSVCSFQAAALPPPPPLAQVNCTAGWRQLWLLQEGKRGLAAVVGLCEGTLSGEQLLEVCAWLGAAGSGQL